MCVKSLFFILLFPLAASAQQFNQDSAWFADNYTKEEIMIPMRDGVKLFTSVYLPKDNAVTHPVLMTRTPYSCAPYGTQYRNLYGNHYKEYLHRHYIMVIQDVRGRYMSEGKYEDIRPYISDKKSKQDIDESSDTYDTVDWLVKNLKNNNGKVGIFGISYPGFYSTMGALSQHPAVVAVSPQAPVTNWFVGDDFHHNGAFFAMDGFSFYSSFGQPRPQPTAESPKGYQFPIEDRYTYFLREGNIDALTKILGDSIRFWQDLMAHPNWDQWWSARTVTNFTQDILPTTNTLVVGGLFDAEDCFGAWSTYQSIESKAKNNNKLVMGPWFHGQWAGRGSDGSSLGNVQFESPTSEWYAQHIEIPFFEYYLNGKGSIDGIKEANIFFTGENKWRTFDKWPAAQTTQAMYLHAGSKLSSEVPTDKKSFSKYTSDPAKPVPYTDGVQTHRTREYMTDDQRFAAQRPDVLLFQTDTLTEDITLAGPLVADLQVALSTTDADFVVKLIDVFPDGFRYDKKSEYPMGGYQMLVRGEIFRGRYRNGFDKPQAFVPGQATEVKYTLPDVAHTFKKGHRIMIQVQSSWFPLADRNPQQFVEIYHAKTSDFVPSDIRVFSNSKVILPVLK